MNKIKINKDKRRIEGEGRGKRLEKERKLKIYAMVCKETRRLGLNKGNKRETQQDDK